MDAELEDRFPKWQWSWEIDFVSECGVRRCILEVDVELEDRYLKWM